MKTKALRALTRKTLQSDTDITQRLSVGIHDATTCIQLSQDIGHLIDDIKKMNRYNDEMQDLRYISYEQLRETLDEPISEPIQPITTSETPQESIEPETSVSSSQTQISIPVPAKDKRQRRKELIIQMVDGILQDLTIANMLDRPKHEQFIHVMGEKLEALEYKCWCLLINASLSEAQFIKKEKERLGFEALSLDAYFSVQIELGKIEAVQALMPLISKSKKQGHYYNLLKAIVVEDTTLSASTVMCEVARFLYRTDEDFQTELKDWQVMLDAFKVDENFCFRSALVILFLNNNLEGFRFFLENNHSLYDAQLIIRDVQFHILDACILLYQHSKIAFIRALFEHGIQVTHTVHLLPHASIEQLKLKAKKHRQKHAEIIKTIIKNPQMPQRVIEDSLDFATHYQPNQLTLIREIATHESLEQLFITLSRHLLDTSFTLRIQLTNKPLFGLVENKKACERFMNTYAAKKNEVSIGCLFYGDDSQSTKYHEKFAIVNELIACIRARVKDATIPQMQDIILNLIQRAKEAQKQPDKQYIALMLAHAGLFAWTQLSDIVALSDFELVLRLLCIRGLVASRVFRTHADEIAFGTYRVGVLLVHNLPHPISNLLQDTNAFKVLWTAYQRIEERIEARPENGLFATATPAATKPAPQHKQASLERRNY